ncbi:hypothetical protein AJ79_07431 [Helicocarpus griseus UAMH5409]|uniref:Uncharacterized protein n=1 Tax=Helicocarpus griseus UAMH5409 TaxID=1447875 RepID=A0A2B7X2G5_9EURO|nr:hypothetical protein AJ79_07431 [Helicocarpus griseus UAMH5409]
MQESGQHDLNDPKKYPRFYLPSITNEPPPDLLPASLIPKFRHKDREFKLLNHLWNVQLADPDQRNYWNIQALHDFWRDYGPPTYEGRRYGWAEEWVQDALESLLEDLHELHRIARGMDGRTQITEDRARRILQDAGTTLEREDRISEKEVKIAIMLAEEDVGIREEERGAYEILLGRKILRDREREREKWRKQKKNQGLGAGKGKSKGAGTAKDRGIAEFEELKREWRLKGRGQEHYDEGNEADAEADRSPTHKPPPRPGKQPIPPPAYSFVDPLKTGSYTQTDKEKNGKPQSEKTEGQGQFDGADSERQVQVTCCEVENSSSDDESTPRAIKTDAEESKSELGPDSGGKSEPGSEFRSFESKPNLEEHMDLSLRSAGSDVVPPAA